MAYISKINGYYIKDASARETAATALQRANDAYSLAEGRDVAEVYDDFNALTTALLALGKDDLKRGTQLFIKEKSVPDYWVTGTVSTATTSAVGSGAQDANGKYEEYTIGYYKIAILETAKVDLSDYAQKAGTYNDMTVGKATNADNATYAANAGSATYAANAGSATNANHATNADNATNAINANHAASADSATNASYAANAGSATNATNDGAGNNIANTYASKDALKNEKITLAVVGEELRILKNGSMITPNYTSSGDSGDNGGGSSGGGSTVYADLNDFGQACSLEYGAKSGDIVIPFEAAGVAENGFDGCTDLESVTFISGGVPMIGNGAFTGCEQLEVIRFNCTYDEFMAVYGSNMEESWLASLEYDVTLEFYASDSTISHITKDELFNFN